ncbi:GNAT family N-acetyltransferase [Oceanihabitans sp.]|nr:GNAT family N-acetyltransferase [Oceanihabitans sp.]
MSFVKNEYLPFYYNVGKNITNGLSYSLEKHQNDYKNKTFLIHDVPSYFNIDTIDRPSSLKIKKIKQYKGFLTDLSQHKTFEDFFNAKYKSSSRYKFNKKTKRLNASFEPRYTIYHENISKEEYDSVMKSFETLIKNRFDVLEKDNDVLSVWAYYTDLFYPLILEKKAVIITITIGDEQVGGALCFLSEDTLFYAITTFNSDYNKFNLGHEIIRKLMAWSFEQGITIFDFSKGEYEYKTRWTNTVYNYECHILYDSKSIMASSLASFLKLKYSLKQFLRDRNVNEQYVKLKFKLKGKKSTVTHKKKYSIEKFDSIQDTSKMQIIDIKSKDFSFLKAIVYDELFKNPEAISKLKIYKTNSSNKESYSVVGEASNYMINEV